jgi:hypothetical protein
MSMTFKRYLYLLLCFEMELKSASSISQAASIFVTVYGFSESFYLQFYAGCRRLDLSTTLQHHVFISTGIY